MKNPKITHKARILAVLLAGVMMTACTLSPPAPDVPELTFAQVQPVGVNAARIEVIDEYQSPMGKPNVEHLFKTTPAQAVHMLVQKQLVAQGPQNTLRVIIEDASVKQKDLPVTTGVLGAFSKEPAQQYDARMAVRFELVDPTAPDIVMARARVNAARSRTVENNISPATRDLAFFGLTEDLMNDLQVGIAGTVKDTLGRRY